MTLVLEADLHRPLLGGAVGGGHVHHLLAAADSPALALGVPVWDHTRAGPRRPRRLTADLPPVPGQFD